MEKSSDIYAYIARFISREILVMLIHPMPGIHLISSQKIKRAIVMLKTIDLSDPFLKYDNLRNAWSDIGYEFTGILIAQGHIKDTPDTVILGVPRGGIPLYDSFCLPKTTHRYLTNSGKYRLKSEPHVQVKGLQGKEVVVLDTLVHSGSTFDAIVAELSGLGPSMIHLVCAMCSTFGLQDVLSRHSTSGIPLRAYTAQIIEAEKIVDGRKMLLGVDLGDLAEKAFACKFSQYSSL